jgi:hypothetical protein
VLVRERERWRRGERSERLDDRNMTYGTERLLYRHLSLHLTLGISQIQRDR